MSATTHATPLEEPNRLIIRAGLLVSALLIGGILVPLACSYYDVSIDEASAVVAIPTILAYVLIRGVLAIAVAKSPDRAPRAHPAFPKALVPMVCSVTIALLTSFAAVIVWVSAWIYSAGIETPWAYGVAMVVFSPVIKTAAIAWVFTFLYIPFLIALKHWRRLMAESAELVESVEEELHAKLNRSGRWAA